MDSPSLPFPALISGAHALGEFGAWLSRSGHAGGAILCDALTYEQCLPSLLSAAPMLISWPVVVVPRGEQCKSMPEAVKIWEQLTAYRLGRNDLLINLGGGSLTDLGGFVASTYLRGISFVHVPTTLLAMVDAALGGKTGIDLGPVKNRIGTFVFPATTVCDPVFLKSLPEEGWLDGLAESIKHAVVGDEGLWRTISDSHNVRETLVTNLERIQAVKMKVVEQDPHEKDLRMILNFGHSIGHAIESCALEAQWGFMTHGRAVALGMHVESGIASRLGFLSGGACDAICSFIVSHFGGVNLSWIYPERLLHFLRLDKKNRQGRIMMSLPDRIGSCRTNVEVDEEVVLAVCSEQVYRS